MKSLALALAILLLLADTAGTGWLVAKRRAEEAKLSDNTLTQLDKVFDMMSDFQKEIENAAGQANYPNEERKQLANRYVREHALSYEIARIAETAVRERRTKDALLRFFGLACGTRDPSTGCALMQPPRHIFGEVVSGKGGQEGKWVSFGNISRLESLEDEFNVLAASMLRDIE